MKRLLILFYCVLISAFAMSQELTVKSFKEKTSDLAASTHERKDGNGNPCALVKVQLATAGAQFSPNIVGNVEYKVNEYWVYLPTISKHLMVKHPNFLTKDIVFADYNVKLEGKTTYELVLAMPETGNTPQIVTSQYLVFNVNPQDAIVEVNGEIWPNTSGIARKFVPFGDYTYSIQSKDYHSVSSSVSVNDPNNKVVVDVKLKPAFGTISVPAKGDLSGAIVYIDNKMAGKVPLTADKISSGTHDIRIAKSMYKSFERTVTVNDGETTTVSPELTANFSTITFNVDNNAEIWINDEKKGIGTWTGNLESGNYRVETRKASHRPQSKEYSIQASTSEQTIKLNAPTPIYGSLNIMAMPDGADIYIDGSKVGETPMFLQQVLIGQHEIRISKSGYSSLRQTINIEEAKATVVNNQLAKAETVIEESDKSSNSLAELEKAFGIGGTHENVINSNDVTTSAETTRSVPDNSRTINGHRFVDLGLPSGKLWAETNIGASKPADDGNYYAWGETKPKANYTWGTYKHGNGSLQYKYSVLRKEDDAAFANWGEPCHLPTREDFEELRKNCSWTWTNQKTSFGKMMNGYLVASKKNRNSIFLPASSSRYENKKDTRLYGDLGYYWSASPNVFLGIDEFDNETLSEKDPCEGFTVRPIAEIGTTTTKVVETFPKFPYGNPQEWIINHFNIPEACVAANAQGIEVVSFVVQEDGSIGEITILNSVHPSVDDAIKQILAKMPKWTPGTQDGKPVRVSYKVPMSIYYH